MSGAPVPTTRLLEMLRDKRVLGEMPVEIRGVAYDSRKVEPGEIFVAIPGLKQDGRRYVKARTSSRAVVSRACSCPRRGRPWPSSLMPTSGIRRGA
jgi:UDP-N-acetylmuramyl pentapeptide synthase